MSKIRRIGDSVDLTIIGLSEELIHEFSVYVVQPHYPGGIAAAIKDLMHKAVEEQKKRKVLSHE
ncbi:MAG: hypothetical protein OEY22_05510 [Candidatus Bathyarchaeota archaeon]|nr:hypothetical protein [Candidatus Bathyarchaeota archaeon]